MKPGDQLLIGLDMVKDVTVLENAYNDNQLKDLDVNCMYLPDNIRIKKGETIHTVTVFIINVNLLLASPDSL